MEFAQENGFGRNRQLMEFASQCAAGAPKAIDPLVRVNLPPLMGRRDASLDLAEELAFRPGIGLMPEPERVRFYWQLSSLLRRAGDDSARILSMLNSPDTRRREHHLLLHVIQLDSLGAALANTFELRGIVAGSSAGDDPLNGTPDNEAAGRISANMSEIEGDLLEQLRESFLHAKEKLMRYRSYAEKSFCKENFSRYRRSYESMMNALRDEVVKPMDFSTPNKGLFQDE